VSRPRIPPCGTRNFEGLLYRGQTEGRDVTYRIAFWVMLCAMRRALALLSAAALATFTLAVAPHLVHHLFEPGDTGPDCPFATTAERLPGDTAVAVTVSTGDTASAPVIPPPPAALPSTPPARAAARAPPLRAS